MPAYDFKALSPIDFEILVRDLLQEELGITLESFKAGRDRGIDLRYSRSGTGDIIIQCKHYAESAFNDLFRHLRDNELPKARALAPRRYILATSMGLTPHQKDQLVALYQPILRSPSDVFGKEDLNNLLGRFSVVERRHFKLWFSSTTVLEELLQTKFRNLRRETLDRIQRDAKYYVQNQSFSEALHILDTQNFCVIAGIPGIGKTTLAEMLLLHYVQLGYDVIKIESDISEAREVDYVNHKRLFYYDDFLGQASTAEKLNKNEDQSLLDFISAIRDSKVSKLILTTREYILNQAQLVYEKLGRSHFTGQTCIVDLSKYTRLIRAQILFNHIYFSDLPPAYKTAIFKDGNYLKIIDHPNYSPRIVDLMSDYSRVKGCDPSRYLALFLSNLENPLEIWRHAFDQQISTAARNSLVVLASMPSEVLLEDVQTAFDAYQEKFTRQYSQPHSPQDFTRALKELDGNFVSSERSGEKTLLRFHNPSVRDFLQNWLVSNPPELIILLTATVFFDQLMWLWNFREGVLGAYKFRSILRAHVADFTAAFRRTMTSNTCGLITYRLSNGQTEKRPEHISFERRVDFLIRVAAAVENGDLRQLLGDLLGQVEQRISDGSARGEDVIGLLEELKEGNLFSPSERPELYAKAKKLAKDNLWHPDDFRQWLRLMDLHPELITPDDDREVKEEFTGYLGRRPDDDNPDSIREDIDKVEELGTAFGVDVSNKVKELREYADNLEEDAPQDWDDDERRGSLPGTAGYCSDAEIHSIFRTLS